MNEVMHALGARLHPVHGLSANPDTAGWTLVPYIYPQEREKGKVGLPASMTARGRGLTKESDIPVRMSFETSYPTALQQKVIAQWKGLWLLKMVSLVMITLDGL